MQISSCLVTWTTQNRNPWKTLPSWLKNPDFSFVQISRKRQTLVPFFKWSSTVRKSDSILFVKFKPDMSKGWVASEAISEGSDKEAKVDSGKASDFLDFSTRNCHDSGGTRAMNPIIFLNFSNLTLSKIFVKTSAIWSSVLTHWMTRTSWKINLCTNAWAKWRCRVLLLNPSACSSFWLLSLSVRMTKRLLGSSSTFAWRNSSIVLMGISAFPLKKSRRWRTPKVSWQPCAIATISASQADNEIVTWHRDTDFNMLPHQKMTYPE